MERPLFPERLRKFSLVDTSDKISGNRNGTRSTSRLKINTAMITSPTTSAFSNILSNSGGIFIMTRTVGRNSKRPRKKGLVYPLPIWPTSQTRKQPHGLLIREASEVEKRKSVKTRKGTM